MERELWQALAWLTMRLSAGRPSWRYSTADILVVYFWAVANDRPTSWAAQARNWPRDLRPSRLPPQCTLSRRLHKSELVALMHAVEEHFQALLAVGCWVWRMMANPCL